MERFILVGGRRQEKHEVEEKGKRKRRRKMEKRKREKRAKSAVMGLTVRNQEQQE